jgi:hypothetical protein
MNDQKKAKAERSAVIVKVNPFTGQKGGTPDSWTCSQCGDGAFGTNEERESGYVPSRFSTFGVAHIPDSARTCQLCDAKVVHTVRLAIGRDETGLVLLSSCARSPVHMDDGTHSDGSPCYFVAGRHITVCHPDWEASCHQRAGRVFRRLYA